MIKSSIILMITALSLAGCASIDKDRAAEHRKSELCRDIATQNQPQCPGQHIPPPPLN